MVGNDILDINFVDAPAQQHVRFLDYVCTPAESRAVRDSADPSQSLAVVWASKEAAYKLLWKQLALGFFVPRQFTVRAKNGETLNSASELRVTHAEIQARVAISTTGQWVHGIATLLEGQVVRWTAQDIGRRFSGHAAARNESDAVRFLAKRLLLACGLEDAELEFVGRVPTVRRRERGCREIGISLSHHGAFASAAIAWQADESSSPQEMNHRFLEISSWEAACSTCMA